MMLLQMIKKGKEEEEERRRQQLFASTPPRAAHDDATDHPAVAHHKQQQQHVTSSPKNKTQHWVNIKEGDRPTNYYYYDVSTPRRRNLSSSATTRNRRKKLSLKPTTIISAAVMVAMVLMGCGFILVANNGHQESSSYREDTSSSSSWHPLFPHAMEEHEEVHNVMLPHHSDHEHAASVTVEVTAGTAYTGKSKHNNQQQSRRRNQGTVTSDGSILPDALPPGFNVSPTLCPATHTLISQSKILRSSYGNIFSVTTPPNPNGRLTSDQLKDISVPTITIQTLSLRMADFRPDLGTNFEVWLYTGDQTNLNDNDMDGNPVNNNKVKPTRDEYQQSRAKFSEWTLLVTAPESELIPDTAFYDNNGHLYNIEPEGDGGDTLGDYKTFDNLEDVTIAAGEWNDPLLRPDGGMDATTQDGEYTPSYFMKIPEDLFIPLLLPKFDGKLTLFVTLDRVGMQYGYARTDEFDEIDVTKHDYLDQVQTLDVLNGNVNLQMHVGEGVILYPWLEEEFFYNTRRFLGKIWYLAQIPCDYSDYLDRFKETPMPSSQPSASLSLAPTFRPTGNMTTVGPGTLCLSALMKEEKEEPMPPPTIDKFEKLVENFVGGPLSDYCLRNEKVTVVNQTLSGTIGGGGSSSPTAEARSGQVGWGKVTGTAVKGGSPSNSRSLWQLLDPISSKFSRRLQVAISKLEIDLLLEGIVNEQNCPDRNKTQMVEIAVAAINDRNYEFMAELASMDGDGYFSEVFGVSVDNCDEVIVAAAAVVEETDRKGAIIGGILGALILCCIICCLPLLIVRRRKHKEYEERELIGDDIEWARPVHEDYFPPLGGIRGDLAGADGDGDGTGYAAARRKGFDGGEFDEYNENDGDIDLLPHSKLRPYGDETDFEYGHRFLDKDGSPTKKKSRPYGMPGRMPGDDDEGRPKDINIYPGGDIEYTEGGEDNLRLRPFEDENVPKEDVDDPFAQFSSEPGLSNPRGGKWSYEADGGIDQKSAKADLKSRSQPSWNRLPEKGAVMTKSMRNLSINPQVLARIQGVKQKMKDLRSVEKEAPTTSEEEMPHLRRVERGAPQSSVEDQAQTFPPRESDDRITQLMNRIKNLEIARNEKYQRPEKTEGESDYEKWRRLQIGDGDLSSSEESSDEEVNMRAAERRKKKKKKDGMDYMIKFDDLDAYNRALAVHEDAYIHKWVRVKVEKDKDDDNVDAEMEGGDNFIDLGDLGGDDGSIASRSMLGDDNASFASTVDLGSLGGDDDTVDVGTLGDESDLSSVGSRSSLGSKSFASRASSFLSRMSRKSKKGAKSLENLDPEEYENEINVQRTAKLSKIVKDRSLSKDEKKRLMNEVNDWYVAALKKTPKRKSSADFLGDLDSDDDDNTVDLGSIAGDDNTVDLGSIAGDESTVDLGSIAEDSTVDLGTIGDESDLSSLASKSSLGSKSFASRASSLVSRMSQTKSLDSLDPEEYENAINAQRAAKISAIVQDRSISKEEKSRRVAEVNQWYAAAQKRSPDKKKLERQETTYLGDLGENDSDDGSDDQKKPPTKRPGLGARQKTEFIGNLDSDDESDDSDEAIRIVDDSDDEPDEPKKPPAKRPGLGDRQKTEFIGNLDSDDDSDEVVMLDDSDDDSDDEPKPQKPPVNRPGLGDRQKTEFIGNLDDEEDSDFDDSPVPVASKPPPRRGLGGRQATKYISRVENDSDDEAGAQSALPARTPRRESNVRFAEPKFDEAAPDKRTPPKGALKRPSALRSTIRTSQPSVIQTQDEPKPANVLTEKELTAQRSAKLSTIMRDRSLDRDERKRRIDEVKQWYSDSLAALTGSSTDKESETGVATVATSSLGQAKPPAKPPLQSMVLDYINTLESKDDLKEDLEGMPTAALQRLAGQLNIDDPKDMPRSQLEQLITESIQSIRKF